MTEQLNHIPVIDPTLQETLQVEPAEQLAEQIMHPLFVPTVEQLPALADIKSRMTAGTDTEAGAVVEGLGTVDAAVAKQISEAAEPDHWTYRHKHELGARRFLKTGNVHDLYIRDRENIAAYLATEPTPRDPSTDQTITDYVRSRLQLNVALKPTRQPKADYRKVPPPVASTEAVESAKVMPPATAAQAPVITKDPTRRRATSGVATIDQGRAVNTMLAQPATTGGSAEVISEPVKSQPLHRKAAHGQHSAGTAEVIIHQSAEQQDSTETAASTNPESRKISDAEYIMLTLQGLDEMPPTSVEDLASVHAAMKKRIFESKVVELNDKGLPVTDARGNDRMVTQYADSKGNILDPLLVRTVEARLDPQSWTLSRADLNESLRIVLARKPSDLGKLTRSQLERWKQNGLSEAEALEAAKDYHRARIAMNASARKPDLLDQQVNVKNGNIRPNRRKLERQHLAVNIDDSMPVHLRGVYAADRDADPSNPYGILNDAEKRQIMKDYGTSSSQFAEFRTNVLRQIARDQAAVEAQNALKSLKKADKSAIRRSARANDGPNPLIDADGQLLIQYEGIPNTVESTPDELPVVAEPITRPEQWVAPAISDEQLAIAYEDIENPDGKLAKRRYGFRKIFGQVAVRSLARKK